MNSPSQWVEPDLDDARKARQWAGIEPRLVRPMWPIAAAVSVALALIIAVVVWMPPWVESQIVAEAVAVRVSTQEGSRILVQPGGRLRIVRDEATQVSVVLEQGAARFVVSKRKARFFEVSAGDLKVVVVGTTFDVSVDGAGVGQVFVTEGIVSAIADGKTYRVVAGESYPPQSEAQAEKVPEPEDDRLDSKVLAEPEADAKPDQPNRVKRRRRVRPKSKAPPKAKPSPTAAQLFEMALLSRRAGRNGQAERTLSELVRLYPSDQRAGLAAFQLGRLRMDVLHNRTGATQAFERALELQPEAVFAEDATARLVELYRRRGFKTRCEAMRQRYQSRYPQGAHLVQVSSSCGGS